MLSQLTGTQRCFTHAALCRSNLVHVHVTASRRLGVPTGVRNQPARALSSARRCPRGGAVHHHLLRGDMIQ
eukprot:1520521-Prymnesium_polylepis.2